MPELQWDELGFLECLEVEPKIEDEYEYEMRHIYKVEKDGLILTVIVRQMESIVWLSLQQKNSDSQLIEFAVLVRGKVRYINDKRGEYLEFNCCRIDPSRFSYRYIEKSEHAKPNWTIELSIKPHIQIRYRD